MALSSKSQVRKIQSMTASEKERYFSTSTRVTVGKFSTVEQNKIKTYYVAKIRGVVVGNSDEWKHETPEAALRYGRSVLAGWRAKYRSSQ